MPSALVQAAAANRSLIEVVGAFCEHVGLVLSSSVFLAPLGAPLAAVGLVLVSIANGCDLGDALRGHARAAATGCKVGAFVATVSIVGLPVAPILSALAPIFEAIGKGKTPKTSDVFAFASVAGKADPDGINLPLINDAVDMVAPALEQSDQFAALIPSDVIPADDKKAALKAAKAEAASMGGKKEALKAAKASRNYFESRTSGGIKDVAGPIGSVSVLKLGAAGAKPGVPVKVTGLSTAAKVGLGVAGAGVLGLVVYAATRRRGRA